MNAKEKKRARPTLERLEDRCAPATGVTASLTDGLLTVTGTDRADRIIVKQRDNIHVYDGDNEVWSGRARRVEKIVVLGQGGADRINLNAPGAEVRKPATIDGGAGKDRLTGGAGKDTLQGGTGNDVLAGGKGQDRLTGGAGKDQLRGGAGKDVLLGGGGRDRLDGGTGTDRLSPGGPPARPEAGPTNLNAILSEYKPTGASAETAGQDGLDVVGVAASRKMAETDRARVMRHQDKFNEAGRRYGLPPALLAAIASRESRGGNALDRNGYGDHGNGFGLMQVDKRYHRIEGAGDPASMAHILQATRILKDALQQVEQAHPNWPRARQLQGALVAYNSGVSNVQTLNGMDEGTTGDDYSNDVWARARYYAARWGGAREEQAGGSAPGGGDRTDPPTGVTVSLADGVLTVTGTGAADRITIKQRDNIHVYDGDTQVWSEPAARVDRIVVNGAAGSDRVNLHERGAEVRKPVTVNGGAGHDRVTGGLASDRLIGSKGNDRLVGAGGNDRISGGSGTDRLIGGPGRDTLRGAAGDDRLVGGPGRDTLAGGPGRDRIDGLVKPVDAPLTAGSEFAVSDPEGAPSNSGARYHAGKDWFADGGTAVRSPIDGEVVEVKRSSVNSGQVFGGTVKVQGRDGKVWVFRHVDPARVREGQRVAAGDLIARVTDWSDGPDHAHIEVWKTLSGGYDYENMIDPMRLLKRFLGTT